MGGEGAFPLPGMGLTAIVDWLAVYFFCDAADRGLSDGLACLWRAVRAGAGADVAIAILALPVMAGGVELPSPADLAGLQAVPLILTELAIGLVAGLVLTILFGAASLAGDRIAATAGLGFAAQYDASAGGQTPVVAQLFGLFLLMVFYSVDGHLAVIRIVLESYVAVPPGAEIDLPRLVQAGIMAGGRCSRWAWHDDAAGGGGAAFAEHGGGGADAVCADAEHLFLWLSGDDDGDAGAFVSDHPRHGCGVGGSGARAWRCWRRCCWEVSGGGNG
jgi:hypothetical protein